MLLMVPKGCIDRHGTLCVITEDERKKKEKEEKERKDKAEKDKRETEH